MIPKFERFIAIDWSGAKGPKLKNLKVSCCNTGENAPILVSPPGNNWRREHLLDWLTQQARECCTLIGMDFAFAYPYCDTGAYFPGHQGDFVSVSQLWNEIDDVCKDADDLYGGPFYKELSAPFAKYLLYQNYTGECFDGRRFRKTEIACAKMGAPPTCPFVCVGPAQVGSGSVAGMRALHRLSSEMNVSIWPFQKPSRGKTTIVEIFPRLFYIIAGENAKGWENQKVLNNALAFFGSQPLSNTIKTEDEADAIISAAALRHLAAKEDIWNPKGLDENARRYEGWIFGVT
jgi:hypothetical protein